uniref:Cell number regulator 6 n=1 Tax=Cucumis melo TaxID=3656 RepID=A0A9I9DQ43_CUCME
MAEGSAQSRYVRLTKDQGPLEDITPGELNQPIQVPQLIVHRCEECGQPLPESYQPPADEDWTTGICETLREEIPWQNACVCHAMCVEGGMAVAAATALFHGIDPQTSFLISETLMFAWWMCGIYTGLFRQSLQKKYHLKNSPCDPCLVHCCMHWCALCQENREMRNHLSDNLTMQMTVIDPPALQAMNTNDDNEPPPSSSIVPSRELAITPI